ncbi:helix-turn-helix transcriptional regulator [Pedobacter riviphilus]|uniref:Helix-turn-helix transcriptional regulator n=1 Tax=Pedobacter riviphilus TaxID=2766984 RepID=A0ABX6THZ9_9SPHI|nr:MULTISPECIES: helix-turn-helix domain-containing protein [Pedobacter]NII81133.1 DNA-binding HxlR family transcriptional regulator [Pedobacter sp. SG908]NMN35150.1 DNA-binding HxlR family transcriptional regulator [Pedobacter sp. SG918]QNR85139.1 helix-turn-helix transcriptional regulator [Pedobacter riviphilus]
MKKQKIEISDYCRLQIQGVKDTQDLLSGKWKKVIVVALFYNPKIRFMDLVRHIEDIAPKVLSKELKDLEANQLVKRTVLDTMPITVEYELTEYGKSLNKIVTEMAKWGIHYRETIFRS